jgi:hypothetical protein
MTKIRTTITIDKELLKLAHHHKIRISTFLHNSLSEYLGQINGSKNFRKVEAVGSNPTQSIKKISNDSIGEYLSFLELKEITKE